MGWVIEVWLAVLFIELNNALRNNEPVSSINEKNKRLFHFFFLSVDRFAHEAFVLITFCQNKRPIWWFATVGGDWLLENSTASGLLCSLTTFPEEWWIKQWLVICLDFEMLRNQIANDITDQTGGCLKFPPDSGQPNAVLSVRDMVRSPSLNETSPPITITMASNWKQSQYENLN